MTNTAIAVMLLAAFVTGFLVGRFVIFKSSLFDPIEDALEKPEELRYHYRSKSTTPDEVEVWRGTKLVYTYNWSDGVSAAPWSNLGLLHLNYQRYSEMRKVRKGEEC